MTDLNDTGDWVTHPAWANDSPPWEQPTLRRVWRLDAAPRRATMRVLAVGVWEAHIGGRRVGDARLEPGSSDVAQRLAERIEDVTDLLRAGDNEFVLQLGEGPSYVRRAPGRYTKFDRLVVAPRARVALEIEEADGSVRLFGSDASWQSRLGPTTLAHWYGGEEYDARLEPEGWLSVEGSSDEGWGPVAVVGSAADGPHAWRRGAAPVRLQDTYDPVAITRVGDAYVADFGRNFAGVVEVEADDLAAGESIILRPAEYVNDDGSVDQFSTGSPVFDRVHGAGRPLCWHPRFVYHGQQFVQVERLAADGAAVAADPARIRVRGMRLMSDNRPTGELELADPVLARIDTLITRAAQSNLYTVPTDCPQREKLGWLEQLHLVFTPVAFRWDIREQWTDMVTHMVDAQLKNGQIPSIAPELTVFDFDFEPGFRDDVNWGGAIWHIPRLLHRHYGDLEAADRGWDAGLRYLEFLDECAGDGLLSTGLGDWIAIDESTPRPLVAAHGHAAVLDSAAEVARALGREAHAERMGARADEVRRALRERYLGELENGSQASAALLADTGALSDEEYDRAVARLVHLLEQGDGAQTVGEIGLPAVIRVLSRAERHDALYRMTTQVHSPGYGIMVRDGATSLCEHWTGPATRRSANHFMLGMIGDWFIESLAGLRQAEGSIGWQAAEISPRPLPGLDSARARFDSVAGAYEVSWRREGSTLCLDVAVPEEGTAFVTPPPGWSGARTQYGPGRHRIDYREDER